MKDHKEQLFSAIEVIKIEIADDEREHLANELEKFLEWLEPLVDLNCEAVEVFAGREELTTVMRDDLAIAGEPGIMQKAAPLFRDGYYVVPPIIE